ncbi:MAG: hypothetical protein AB1894_00355 [Chloroflexota bacterium]
MNIDQISSGSSELRKLLADMNQTGGFIISVLTDRQGLPIAFAAAPGSDPERQSAVVALVQKTAAQASTHLGITTDEISLNAVDGQRLVCRPFEINGNTLILAVMVAERSHSYRRLTNQTIRRIAEVWKSYWE